MGKTEYYEDLDVMYIENNSGNKSTKWNLPLGNLVLDLASNGKVLGIEINEASKMTGLSEEQMKNVSEANVSVEKLGS